MLNPDPKGGSRLPKVLHPRLPGASEGCSHPQVRVVPGQGPQRQTALVQGPLSLNPPCGFVRPRAQAEATVSALGFLIQTASQMGEPTPPPPPQGKRPFSRGALCLARPAALPVRCSASPGRGSPPECEFPGVPPGPRPCRVGLSVQLRPSPGSGLPSTATLCRGAPASVPTSQQPSRQASDTHPLGHPAQRACSWGGAGRGRGRARDLNTLPCLQRNMRTFTPRQKNEDSETASHFRFCLHVHSCWVGFCCQMGYDFGFASWRLQGRGYDHLCDPQRLQEAHRSGFVCPEPLRPMTGGAGTP